MANMSSFALQDKFSEHFKPWMYSGVGTVLCFVWIIGFTSNLAVLYSFLSNKQLRTTDTCLIMGLALSDIGQTIFGIPFVIVSSFLRQWVFGMYLCQFNAFITTTLGIAQITTLTFIAVERYYIIVHYQRKLSRNTTRCAVVISCSFLHGCLWATGPLLGWSRFKLEETELACCVTWEAKDAVDLSYTLSICTIGWLIPLLIIAYVYMSIACKIHSKRNELKHLRRQTTNTQNNNREKKVAITVLLMIGAFVISWMPYSVLALWSALGDYNSIPLGVHVIPAIFAKCSIIWNPLIYVARHRKFRKGVLKSLPTCTRWQNMINTGNVTIETPKVLKKHYLSPQADIAALKQSIPPDRKRSEQNNYTLLPLFTATESSVSFKRKQFQNKDASRDTEEFLDSESHSKETHTYV